MKSYSSTQVKNQSSPCGCGGGSTTAIATVSTCSCGNAGCSSCQNQGFVRPRFFAGQLLTEEDLQLLTEYIAGKNRLHNRHMFGEGVVCGLDVTCNPCGGSHVIVNAGYALDCCGNDITLPCPQELDINAMVRELRRNLLGRDCGDPCADAKKQLYPAEQAAPTVIEVDATGAATGKQETESTESELTRHYCLYIRYCEEMTDPVSPYATDEPCSFQTCEPTRVREGFRFELRCREEQMPHANLLSRICACIGDLISAEKTAMDAKSMSRLEQQAGTAIKAIRESPTVTFETAHLEQMKTATLSTRKAVEEMKKAISEESMWNALEEARVLESYPARFLLLDEQAQESVIEKARENKEDFAQSFREAQEVLNDVSQSLPSTLISQNIESPVDQAYASTIAETADELSAAKRAAPKSTPGTGHTMMASSTPSQQEQAQIDRVIYRLWAEGLAWSKNYQTEISASLLAIREALLDRLDKSPHITDCDLPRVIRSLALSDKADEEVSVNKIENFYRSARTLIEALRRYIVGCLCAALNPPCPPCDDMGVLLACLEVRDCEVINICNLERTFVLTAVALRYWLPVGQLGEAIEEFCCPTQQRETKIIDPYPGKKGFYDLRIERYLNQSSITRLGSGLPSKFYEALASLLVHACSTSTEDARRFERIILSLFAGRESTAGASPYVISSKIDPKEVAEALNDSDVRATFNNALDEHLDERLPVLREENEAAISTAVDKQFALAMASPDFKSRVVEAINNGTVSTALGSIVEQSLNEKLPTLRREEEATLMAAITEKVAALRNESAAMVAAELDRRLADMKALAVSPDEHTENVKTVKSLKRSHANLIKKSTGMERRLKRLEAKGTP
ncbi:MAG TPA: hypothetical protein VK619_00080 [Pyrinomonadaceae bacterium]|nr:hypothetical protein [Pyrinomonadaceae bacterium]